MSYTLHHPKYTYTKGLHDLGDGAYAWLQPDGGWGWSNSGLIVDHEQSLVVDTLSDAPLTLDMLRAYSDAESGAKSIDIVVNTHHNNDHCNGNCCCPNATFYAHKATAENMVKEPPQLVQSFLDAAPNLGNLGEYLTSCFGPFDYKSVEQRVPDNLFEEETIVKVGDKDVHFIPVGPAHTPGDTLVYVPSDRTIYTGDILFIGGIPILWDGPVENWINACNLILELDLENIVPGHGPITTKDGVRAVRDYWVLLKEEARKRYDAGLSFTEAARDIQIDVFNDWNDSERIVVNCATLYSQFSGTEKPDITTLFTEMSNYITDTKEV